MYGIDVKYSIIVATYNRCDSLKMLLDKLREIRIPDQIMCEVLVIDNNSSDNTKVVVEHYLSSKAPEIRYIFERIKGKSNALNAGIRNAKGDILVFTDDDCIPDEDWISSIHDEFMKSSSIAALGGKVMLFNHEDRDISTVYHDSSQLITSLRQLFPPMVIGCNMAIRKNIILEVGQFDTLLGPGSADGAISEDVDIIYRIMKKNYKVLYSPQVLVLHNHGRKKEDEIISLMKGYYKGQGAFYWKHIRNSDIIRKALSDLHGTGKTLLKGFITRNNYSYHKIFIPSLFLGAMHYFLAMYRTRRVQSERCMKSIV